MQKIDKNIVTPKPMEPELETTVRLKDAFRSFSETTTSHGLPKIVQSGNRSTKIVWIFLFFLASAISIILIKKNINEYLKYRVVSQMRVFHETPVDYPTLSICNINPFMTDFAAEYIYGILNENNMSYILNRTQKIKESDYLMALSIAEYLVMQNAKSINLENEKKKLLGLPLKDFILSCHFNGIPCDFDELVWFYSIPYGNCFKFNSGYNVHGEKVPIKRIGKAGQFNGLYLELFIGQDIALETFSSSNGAHIFIHNHTENPHISQGIDISVGTLTSIAVDRHFISKHQFPYSDCISDEVVLKTKKFYNILTRDGLSYKHSDCIDLCYQQYLISQCNCYDVSYDFLNSTTPCTNITHLNCFANIYSAFFQENIYMKCAKTECMLECGSNQLTSYVSTADYPNRNHANRLKSNSPTLAKYRLNESNYQTVKNNVLAVTVFYNFLGYTLIRERESMTFIDLISNIGLFVGISLLSLIEIFEMLLEVIYIVLDSKIKSFRRRQTNRRHTVDS